MQKESFEALAFEIDSPDNFNNSKYPGLHSFDRSLRCPICSEILTGPMVNKCGCMFCSKCIHSHWNASHAKNHKNRGTSHSRNEICPLCQGPYDITESIPVRTLGKALDVYRDQARDEITDGLEDGSDSDSNDSDDGDGGENEGKSARGSGGRSEVMVVQEEEEVQFLKTSSKSDANVVLVKEKIKRVHIKRPNIPSMKLAQLKDMMLDYGCSWAANEKDPSILRSDLDKYIIEHNSALDAMLTVDMIEEEYVLLKKSIAKEMSHQRFLQQSEQSAPRYTTKHSGAKGTEDLKQQLAANIKAMERKIQPCPSHSSSFSSSSSPFSSSSSSFPSSSSTSAERRNGNSDDRWISIWSEVNNKWFYYHEAFKYGQWEKPDDYPRPPPFVRDSCTQTDLRRIEQKVIAKPPSSTSSSKSSIGGERKKKNDGTNTTLNNTVHVVEDNDSGSDESGSDGSKKSSPRLFSSFASSTSSTSSNTSSTSSTFSTSSRKRSLGGKETTKQSTKISSQQQRKKMRKGGAGKQRSSSATKSREGGSRFEKCFLCHQDILKSKGLQAHIREKHPEIMD